MGIFSRFMDIVNANINALLDKAEDPEKMIRLMMQEMEDTLIELKSSCAAKIAAKTTAERKLKEYEALIDRWMNRAELAIAKGREDLAREALIEKRKAQTDLEQLEEDITHYESVIAKSKEDINRLEDKVRSLRQKHQSIIERAVRAKEAQAADESVRRASDARFDQMEQQVERMEANASMSQPKVDLESKFVDLEQMDDIEAELEKLRKQNRKTN